MSNQEKQDISSQKIPEDYQEGAHHLDPAVINRLTMLNLHQSPPNSAATRRFRRLKRCRTCGTLKRKSPSHQELPFSKRSAAGATDPTSPNPSSSSPPSSSSRRNAAVNRNLCSTFYQDLVNPNTCNALNQVSTNPMGGNLKNTNNLQLGFQGSPVAASISPLQQPLGRSLSDPILSNHQPEELLNPATFSSLNQVSNPPMEGNFKNTDDVPGSQVSPLAASIPPLPLPLGRSLSDPISSNRQPLVTKTPPRHPIRSSDQEPPSSRKLMKFKERIEEMRQWMAEIVSEEDEDTTLVQKNDNINNYSKEQAELENQESVWVKKTEGGLILHFKCPCGCSYEIFLHGDKCFYRLS